MAKLKELLKALFPDKTEIIDKAEIEEPAQKQTTTTSGSDEETKKLIETMLAENKKLLDELTLIKQQDEERQKLLETKAKEERIKEIDSVIKKAIEDGRIESKNEEKIKFYKDLLQVDFEKGKKVIDDIKPVTATKELKQEPANSNASTGNKTLDAVRAHSQAAAITKPFLGGSLNG